MSDGFYNFDFKYSSGGFDPDSRLNDLRAAYGFDPARPGHDKTVASYYDPATGQYFQCDINLDTFRKSEECILADDSKYFRFLQAFNVEDAQIVA